MLSGGDDHTEGMESENETHNNTQKMFMCLVVLYYICATSTNLLATTSTSPPHAFVFRISYCCSPALTLADSDIQMSVNITNFKEAMDWRYPDKPPNARQRVSPRSTFASGHLWTTFEREALLGLMAAQYHNGDPLGLATMLNKALNDSDYHSDINTHDIQREVKRLLLDYPNFASFLARHNSGKMTRQLKKVFHRDLKHSAYRGGNGRRDRVRWVPHLNDALELQCLRELTCDGY
jgi:hypothetical protein